MSAPARYDLDPQRTLPTNTYVKLCSVVGCDAKLSQSSGRTFPKQRTYKGFRLCSSHYNKIQTGELALTATAKIALGIEPTQNQPEIEQDEDEPTRYAFDSIEIETLLKRRDHGWRFFPKADINLPITDMLVHLFTHLADTVTVPFPTDPQAVPCTSCHPPESVSVPLWDRKRGFYELSESFKGLYPNLRKEVEASLRMVLARAGAPDNLLLADLELIRSQPGEGRQELHFDLPRPDTKVWTVLLYLSHTWSSGLPILSHTKQRVAWHGRLAPSKELSDQAMARARQRFSRHEHFVSFRVQPGDAAAFPSSTLHFGTKNVDSYDRYVIFGQFYSPQSSRPVSNDQFYPHGVETDDSEEPDEESDE
jgi:hypothetical protein